MNAPHPLEQRVRESLMARAAGVEATPVLWERVEQRLARRRRRRLVSRGVAIAVVVVLVVVANSSVRLPRPEIDVAPEPEEGIESAAPEEPSEPEPSQTPSDGQLVVGLEDGAFVGLPATVPSGTVFTVENLSEEQIHELLVIRLPDDELRPVEEIVALPESDVRAFFRTARFSLVQAPGSDEVVSDFGSRRVTAAGRYMAICALPTGVDPDAYIEALTQTSTRPDLEGGPPHYMNGMWGEFEIAED